MHYIWYKNLFFFLGGGGGGTKEVITIIIIAGNNDLPLLEREGNNVSLLPVAPSFGPGLLVPDVDPWPTAPEVPVLCPSSESLLAIDANSCKKCIIKLIIG